VLAPDDDAATGGAHALHPQYAASTAANATPGERRRASRAGGGLPHDEIPVTNQRLAAACVARPPSFLLSFD
jgi:hypothetical protein